MDRVFVQAILHIKELNFYHISFKVQIWIDAKHALSSLPLDCKFKCTK